MDISKRSNRMIANIESANPFVKKSQLPSLRYYNEIQNETKKVGAAALFQQDLMFLNEKLENVQKRLTFYDFYNITAIVEDPALVQTTINNLLPNTALIINTNNAAGYSRGDIVFKTSSGNSMTIRAQTGGLYYPSQITTADNTNYTVSYAYTSSEPTAGSSFTGAVNGTAATPAASISFSGIKAGDPTEGVAYGIIKNRGEANWNQINLVYRAGTAHNDNNLLYPVIKFFTTENEEVYFTYTITKSTSTLTITSDNIPSIVMKILYK